MKQTCKHEDSCKLVDNLSMIIAEYDQLLTDICNEYMEANGDGSFKSGNGLADRANKLLGV